MQQQQFPELSEALMLPHTCQECYGDNSYDSDVLKQFNLLLKLILPLLSKLSTFNTD